MLPEQDITAPSPESAQAHPDHNLATLLASRAKNNSPALISPHPDGVHRLSYRQLAQMAARIQRYLTRLGVKEGDRVGLSLPNIPLMPALYYGIAAAGAICVPLNPLLSGAELEHHLADSGAEVLFAWEGTRLATEAPDTRQRRSGNLHLEILSPTEDEDTATLDFTGSPDATAPAEDITLEPVPVTGADPAVILYTSGTTGKPKGAILTHANILTNARSCVEVFGFTNKDIIFGGLPLFHAFGQTVAMNAVFSTGASIALLPRFTPAAALNLIQRARVSILAAVPSMYLALATELENNPVTHLRGQIRFGISGGSPLPHPAHQTLKRLISCPVYEGYGLSETAPVVSFNRAKYGLVIGSVGRALPGVRVQVRDKQHQPVPVNEPGQLWVSGENVMAGYWNNPVATEKAFDGAWFATGDIARIDAEGNIYIIDRIKDMVLRNGYSVYPREIEDVLYTHPEVAAAAVIGLADAHVGEEITAIITPRPGANTEALEKELDKLAHAKLAAYKHPRHYRFVTEMPLGPTGKILKHSLRARYGKKE